MRMIQNHVPQTRDPFQNLFTHLFRDSLGGLCDPQSSDQSAPRTNIGETDSAYELSFELPGVEEKDIQVQLHEKTLTVTAERASDVEGESDGEREEPNQKKRRWHRVEHRYGQFSRAISLPTDAANDGVEAVYRAGVLTVTVPKQAEAQPARITVRSA